MKTIVLSDRTVPTPSNYLKSFFGGGSGTNQPFYLELLTALEESIPDLENELVRSSLSEMQSRTDQWVLFYHVRHSLYKTVVHFPDRSPLKEEMQRFLIFLYTQLSVSGKEPFKAIWKYANSICRIVESINRDVSSATEITTWDYRRAIMSLSQESSTESIRRHLFRMKKFVTFLDAEVAERAIPISIIPQHCLNPRQPFEPIMIKQIGEYSAELPEYVWLAFQLFAITGARASSVFELTVDDVTHLEDKWVVRIYYGKAESRKSESNTPSFVSHELPSELAKSINDYIAKTAQLRDMLSCKYIFVYQSSWFRPDSAREPRVLDADTFAYTIRRLCKKHEIYDSNGMIPTWPGQGIRAEVGRSLFANGASPETVAAKLGNTAGVATRHYDSMYPSDEANMRRALYAQTIDAAVDADISASTLSVVKNDPMYGSCRAHEGCQNGNDCRNCTELIQQKQRGA